VFNGLGLVEITCGFMYQMWIGWLFAAIGVMFGAVWMFLLMRYVLRNQFIRRYGEKKWFKVARMAMEEDAFKIACLLRLSPIHFGLTTSICAMTSISFPRYVLATFIGMNVEMPLYVFAGTTLRSIADTTTTGLDTTQWILIAVQGTVIIVLFVVLTVGVRRVLKRYNLQVSAESGASDDVAVAGELRTGVVVADDVEELPVSASVCETESEAVNRIGMAVDDVTDRADSETINRVESILSDANISVQ